MKMRTVDFNTISDSVQKLCIQAACNLPADVSGKLKDALASEPFPRARYFLDQILTNEKIASDNRTPLCQDTGFAVFFVSIGSQVTFNRGTLVEAINEGTKKGYAEGYLRKSIVNDPLFARNNTGDNTPAIIHIDQVPGEKLEITLLPKGGGCENMSYLSMLKPSAGKQGVVDFVTDCVVKSGGNPCPPVIVGVGIGGTADKACLLAKKSLLRETGIPNGDPQYALLEAQLLEAINKSGLGPQGLGGKTTALAVHIEHFPCHIASMPVAVNLNCHSARRAFTSI